MRILTTLFISLLFTVSATAEYKPGTIGVNGHSEIILEPQYCIILTEVRTVNANIETSFQNLQTSLGEIIGHLKQMGLTDKDITKSIIRQGSEYSWENNSRRHRGFYSSCNMEIRINTISNMHRVYSLLAKYNLVSINGTRYGRDDEKEHHSKEMKKALQTARNKANNMANTMGVTLGRVLSISETGVSGGGPVAFMRADEAPKMRTGGTFGSVTISANVHVVFAIDYSQ